MHSEMPTYTCNGVAGLRGGASNSRNNIILPFTVARVIDDDEERPSCGGLHQPLYVLAALVK